MAGVDRETLDSAWREVEASWEDAQAHRRFLELSRLGGDLKGAGQRYRAVRERDPARAPMAAAQIDRLLDLAMQDMKALRRPPRKRSRAWLWAVAALMCGLALLLARMLLLQASP